METKSTEMKIAKNTAQTGDIKFRRLPVMPEGEKVIVAKNRCTVGHGESGHFHIVEGEDAELLEIGDRMVLNLPRGGIALHEEHNRVAFEPGLWEVGRVNEFDWISQMTRKVVD